MRKIMLGVVLVNHGQVMSCGSPIRDVSTEDFVSILNKKYRNKDEWSDLHPNDDWRGRGNRKKKFK